VSILTTQSTRETKIEKFSFRIAIVIYVLLCILILNSVYSILKEKNDIFIREHTITVNTFICYTTDHGNKYHADYCQYLWNSSNLTTVYMAKRSGYSSCSACSPYIEKQIEVYEPNGDVKPFDPNNATTIIAVLFFFFCGVSIYAIQHFIKTIYAIFY
jgi:hypothetical protein